MKLFILQILLIIYAFFVFVWCLFLNLVHVLWTVLVCFFVNFIRAFGDAALQVFLFMNEVEKKAKEQDEERQKEKEEERK